MFSRGLIILAGLTLTAGAADAQGRRTQGGFDRPARNLARPPHPPMTGFADRRGYSRPFPPVYPPDYWGSGFAGGFGGFGGGFGWAAPVILYPDPVLLYPDPPAALPTAGTAPLLPPHYLSAGLGRMKRAETAAMLEYRTALTLELPAAAELWVNGDLQSGRAKERHEVTAPRLSAGETWTANLRAEWTAGGRVYEYTTAVTLTAGDSKTLLVYSGTPVKN